MTKKQFCLTLTLTVLAGFLGGLLAGFLFTAGAVQAQSEEVIHKVIRAESFEVRDSQGMLYARLGHGTEKGRLALMEFGEEGVAYSWFEARRWSLNASLEEDSLPKISLTSSKDRGTRLTLRGNAGNMASLNALQKGTDLNLKDEKGDIRLMLASGGEMGSFLYITDENSFIDISDQNKQQRALIGTDKGVSFMYLFDQGGEERVSISATEQKGVINFSDKYGNLQAGIGEVEGKGMVMP